MTTRREYTAGRATTLASAFNIGATTFTITDDGSADSWPTSVDYDFFVTIDAGTAQEERVLCSARAGRVITIAASGRGKDSTGEKNHSAGATVWPSWSAQDADEANAHIYSTGYASYSKAVHGLGSGDGVVVGTDKSQTLTAKTLTAPTITSPTISGTITGAVVTSANIVDGTIVNADINASAAIDWTKLAISSTVSATELGYVDGVTSAIQTQLDGKVTTPGAWSSWTPTLGNLTLGSGSTATYKYNQVGKTVNFSIDITFAGTSSGSSGSLITFTLPVTASGNYKGVFASGGYATASGSSPFTIFGLLSSGSTTVMRLNYPVTGSFGAGLVYGTFGLSSITAGAYLQIAGTYEAV